MKLIAACMLCSLLFACQTEIQRVKEPAGLIPRDTMVMLLQDLSVLESHITDQYPEVGRYQKIMKQSGDALLKEYHVSFERFNKSIDYYGSRQEEMQSIYSEVQDSLTFKLNRLQ